MGTTRTLPVIVSQHAEQRGRERLGLNRRAIRRAAERAIVSGAPARNASMQHPGTISRLHGNGIYVFSAKDEAVVLVTVLRALSPGLSGPHARGWE